LSTTVSGIVALLQLLLLDTMKRTRFRRSNTSLKTRTLNEGSNDEEIIAPCPSDEQLPFFGLALFLLPCQIAYDEPCDYITIVTFDPSWYPCPSKRSSHTSTSPSTCTDPAITTQSLRSIPRRMKCGCLLALRKRC
jgi:hypothetical protein